MIKLNLGCGIKRLEGYVNIDARDIPEVDIVHDLKQTLPYQDNSVEEIKAIDVIEHFSYRDTDRIFEDWVRVLKKGGRIEIVVPDIDKHIMLYIEKKKDKGVTVDIDRLRHIIFGCQDHPYNFHYNTFNQSSVTKLFEDNGLSCYITHTKKAMIVNGIKL